MIEDILKELRELTKFCYGLKTEIAIVLENQILIKEMFRDFEIKIEKLEAKLTELEKENAQRVGFKNVIDIAARYWYVVIAGTIFIAAGPSAAVHFLGR